MRINNSTDDFFRLYKPDANFDIQAYHHLYPDIFHTYFESYCKRTPDKMQSATNNYASDYIRLKKVATLLPEVIQKAEERTKAYFGFEIDVKVHIFTGIYASNAFVDHSMDLYFAIEKLEPDASILEVIVTHEMIHSYHYHLLGRAGIDWHAINWADARTSMYLEGIATYFSEKLVPGHSKSVYFSYDKYGGEWLSFCQNQYKKIVEGFLSDLMRQSSTMERDWFRLSAHPHFGYSRLGYFLGTAFVSQLCKKLPETEVFTLLAQNLVSEKANKWLEGTTDFPLFH